jgi:electron transport complex protein RnfA
MNSSITVLVVSGLFLNLPIQFGLGIKEIWHDGRHENIGVAFCECLVLFLSIIIQWLLFTYILSPLNLGFFKYFALFPFSSAISSGFELLCGLVIPKHPEKTYRIFSFSAVSGLATVAVLLMLFLGGSFREALLLGIGFSAGAYFSIILLRSMRIRVSTEKVSALFKGMPLLLVSMGLLSLVFVSAAIIYLQGTFK